ncbi:MAG: hypothetical protein ABL962_14785 [Fimbriimonadaceae bacterium]
MPQPSAELSRQRTENLWDEIQEIVRVFTVYDCDPSVSVRVTILRNYTETGYSYGARYERRDESGQWHDINFGTILSGSDSEESTIMIALSFVRGAHRK